MLEQHSSLMRPWGAMTVYEWSGEDPALLFLHGNGCAARDWELVRPYLPYHALSLDFAGHGASDVPSAPFSFTDLVGDVLALIESRRLDTLILVGHSLGGMVGLEVASRSRAVAVLVLVEGWTGSAAWGAFGQGHHFGGLQETVAAEIQAATRNLSERLGALNDPYWQSVCAFDGYAMLEQITIPVVEIYGTVGWREDTLAKLQVPDTPYIQLRWLDGAGHFLLQERPDAVAQICREARAMIAKGGNACNPTS